MEILGSHIELSEARVAYNKYRLQFQEEADRAVMSFCDKYQANASLDDVVHRAKAQITESIQPTIDLCIKTLIGHNVLTVDQAQFEVLYGGYQDIWGEAFFQIYDKYAEIVMDQKQLDEYRVARRQNRSRWQGGGFGLSGALQGAAMAGALNILTGAGHMVFNGLGKVISSISSSMEKNKIFNDPNTYDTLANGVWLATFSLHIALIDCLSRTGADPLPQAGAVGDEDLRNSAALLNNAKLIQDTEQCRQAMIRSFQLNPYAEDWYIYALERFGDVTGSLSDAERYFGLSVLQMRKAKELDDFAKTLPIDTEALALAAKQEIQDKKEKLNYYDETEHTQIILDTLKQYDLAHRTVDNIVMPTRSLADIARQELSAIEKVEATINYDSLTSIAEGIEKISEYTSPVAQNHQQRLQSRWDQLDITLRTVDTLLPNHTTILCETPAQAERFRVIAQELSQRLQDCGEGYTAEQPLQTLQRQLISDGTPPKLLKAYQDEIAAQLAQIDLTLRTTLGKVYPTREAARAAEATYDQIRADLEAGNPRKNGDKFRQRIEAADLSEETKRELKDELFQLENAKELKTAKTFSTITSAIILAIVIGSYFFSLSGTVEFAHKDVIVRGVSLMVTDVEVVDHFTFVDGLKNGLVVFGRCIGDIFVNGFFEYIGGFSYGLIGNIIWAFLGLFWVVIKEFFIGIGRYFVSLVVTLLQAAPITYYIGYVIGSAIPLAATQFNFDEDTQEENVKRIKGWKLHKIIFTVLIIVALAAASIYFIYSGK